MTRFIRSLGGFIIASMLVVAGCGRPPADGGKQAPAQRASITLNSAGASFPYPLYSKWIAEYVKVAPEVSINYQSIGSGGGIQQLKAGTVDFGASDAPLSDEEMKAMPGAVVHLPTAAGAVAVVYKLPQNQPAGRRQAPALLMSGPVVAAIFLGEITRWNDKRITDLNPGVKLPDLPIAVTYRSDGSGTTYLFTSYLSAVSLTWAGKVGAAKSVQWPVGIGAKGNEGVTGIVKQTPGAIGYVELAYASQNDLSFASIQNAAGEFVPPSTASVTAAASGATAVMEKDVRVSIINSPGVGTYPIAGFTYLLVYREQKDPAKGKALLGFLDWAIHDGQAFAERLGYAPLPAAVVTINENALKTITIQGTN